MRLRPAICGVVFAVCAFGQVLSTGSLTGKYFVRHVQFATDANNNVTDARSIVGAMTFNGSGNYSFVGQQVVGTGSAASFSVSGTYSVASGGNVTMTNPQNSGLSINARFGAEAVVGSSTEAAGNVFDMFVAIPAPVAAQNNAGLGASFQAADFELTGASTAQVRDSVVAFTLDGAGNISTVALEGHAANLNGGASVTQVNATGSYSVNADGTGTITFPGLSMMSSAQRTLMISATGHVILAGTPGGHDLFVAIRSPAGTTGFSGRSWVSGLRVDSTGSSAGYVGSSTVIAADKSTVGTRRLHISTSATPLNVTAASLFTVAADGTGLVGPAKLAVGTGAFVSANVGNVQDPSGYEISFGETIPTVSGTGVFVNPQGVVNAASNAPAGDGISPGEFIAIYGSGLAGATLTATPPYPVSLGGVSVSIGGLPAPIYLVSSGQINCLVPYKVDTTKASLTLTVSNGAASNQVTVPVARTSPGIFSNDTSGTGDGAFLHVNTGLLVTPANPAKKGEVLSVYLTGLGGLQNAVPDGTAPNPPAADNAVTQIALYVNGVAAAVSYSGLNPVYPGLYQINFTVPVGIAVSGELPVALLTPEAYTDQINLSVQ